MRLRMRTQFLFAVVALLAWASPLTATAGAAVVPVKIIFDTDMETDCDDAGALAVLQALADRGECEILATMVSCKDPWSAVAVEVINTYYGRPGLPIGVVKGKAVIEKSRYVKRLGEEFPHQLKSGDEAPDAALLYREVLEKQPDHSVVVVTVGYLTNLKNLLQLPAEKVHLSGADLIRKKVSKWVCMGGNFVGYPPKDDLKLGNVNFQRDADSAYYTISHWPGPIDFVGREIGSVPSGLAIGESLAQTPTNNPVRMAYFYYLGKAGNRHVADLTTVLYAVRGLRDYWEIQPKGYMEIHSDMTFEWKFGEDRKQAYLLKKRVEGKVNDHYIERTLDELLVQPPRTRK